MPFHRTVDGTRVHFRDVGDGPVVVLIPGLGGDGSFWEGVQRNLRRSFRLVVVDHRGAGASDRPAGPYTIPLVARDTLEILSGLGVDRASFVGHSTGGMIAQTIATNDPDRVDKLVLSGTWDRPDLRFHHLFEARMALLREAGPVAYQKLTQSLGYDPEWMEANAAALEAELESAATRLAPLDVQLARIAMLLEHDCCSALTSIARPTLVVGASDDALIPYDYAERLASRIPGAWLVPMKGGHFHPRAYPAPFADALIPFLEITS